GLSASKSTLNISLLINSGDAADSSDRATRAQRRFSDHRRLALAPPQFQSARADARPQSGAMARTRAPRARRRAEAERARGASRNPAYHADTSDRPDGGGGVGGAATRSERSPRRAALSDVAGAARARRDAACRSADARRGFARAFGRRAAEARRRALQDETEPFGNGGVGSAHYGFREEAQCPKTSQCQHPPTHRAVNRARSASCCFCSVLCSCLRPEATSITPVAVTSRPRTRT